MVEHSQSHERIQVGRQNRRLSDRVTLLQLSDLHFTSKTRVDDTDQEHFLSHFEQVLTSHLEREGTAIDLVVVTGDLVDNASSGDDRDRSLATCRSYLEGLCSRLGIPRPADSMIVIPGNHDYRWTGLKPSAKAKARFQSEFSNYLGHRLFPHLGLFVGAFDSNVAMESVEWARGWVDTRAFSRILTQAKGLAAADRAAFRDARRIALVHHHPMPVPTAEERHQGFLERKIGKKMDGAVEHMLLKNSGTFLLHALELGFQAVLHGHFHRPSFWRTVADTSEGSRALEIFGSRSLGSAAEGDYGFNLITLYNENDLAVLPFSYTVQGLGKTSQMRPRPVGSASYEDVRAARWRFAERAAPGRVTTSFASKDHLIKWQVHLPSGDLLTRELIHDFEVRSGQIEELSFARTAPTLTREEFRAWWIVGGERTRLDVTTEEGEPRADGSLRIIHTLRFPSALTADNTPINLELRRATPGVMFIDLADLNAWGLSGTSDFCIRTIKIPTRHLSIGLSIDAVDVAAPQVVAQVLEPGSGRKPAQRELDSERVNIVSWDGREAAKKVRWDMSVRLPLTGYRYGFMYRIPAVRRQDKKVGRTLDMRARFWGRTTVEDQQAVVASAMALLADFLEKCKMPSSSAECALLGWVGRKVHRAASGPLLADYVPRWGRDIAGAAFRLGAPIRLSQGARPHRAHRQALARVPEAVRSMIASPLGCFDKDLRRYRTVLVLVFASTDRNDGLARIAERDERAREFDLECRDFWPKLLQEQPFADL